MKIFLSFIGNHDPYANENKQLGPILSILQKRKFNKAFFFINSNRYWEDYFEIQAYCNKNYPDMELQPRYIESLNPTDYSFVYPAMYQDVKKIVEDNPKAKYTISLTSGTPTMHSCWILLSQGGILEAKLLQVSRESGLKEVSFDLDDFPKLAQPEIIKTKVTQLSRENKQLLETNIAQTNSQQGFYIPDEGVDLDNKVLPAYYRGALNKANGNKAQAARLLGLLPHTFRKRLKKYNIE